MSDITATASVILAMSHSRTQDQISMSILKMNAQAEQAVADMLIQSSGQIQALSNSSQKIIDLYI